MRKMVLINLKISHLLKVQAVLILATLNLSFLVRLPVDFGSTESTYVLWHSSNLLKVNFNFTVGNASQSVSKEEISILLLETKDAWQPFSSY